MIQETITYHCRKCGSPNIVKNGHNQCGNPQYHGKDCGAYRTLKPKQRYTPEEREQILKVYQERASMRAIQRVYGVSRSTLANWIKKVRSLPAVAETVQPAQAHDVLELDEFWSFVGREASPCWLWVALCRRTRQVVAFVLGDRSEQSCRRLWQALPEAYRACQSFSDFWRAYAVVFPRATHRQVGKSSGELARVEQWFNTLRQRLGRYVRKTLWFSKSAPYHEWVTRWFIVEYNLSLSG